ncbi:MAG: hypothetical protein A3C15_00245 [Candidatus Magasanikbacteria bacterium RIFCSPHIGHO2_02_FULL_50_9b]|uniref:Uncharacterized protein n=1 Tax=Candidatus Magasanikbacteria bacterium RIFCSPHIGHO2_02_FULL_50_9b TaxID=1798682 RepID=A0A1F6M8P7_9BACT|nr:MAG: hypothetical protein A3C15_00245 [Candidatus Magasanikbacteria bacterium RIFCSPHIGHO2_02_FULL_50_9b]
MDKLSYVPYSLKCILGAEIMYVGCIFYGTTLNKPNSELHHALLGLLPGFTWGSLSSAIVSGVVIAAYAFIFGLFMVWMHNSSMKK